jgi:hypothetical protein
MDISGFVGSKPILTNARRAARAFISGPDLNSYDGDLQIWSWMMAGLSISHGWKVADGQDCLASPAIGRSVLCRRPWPRQQKNCARSCPTA